MIVKRQKELKLNHRAYTKTAALNGYIIVASNCGDISIINNQFELVNELRFEDIKDLESLSASPVDDCFAISDGHKLRIITFDGQILYESKECKQIQYAEYSRDGNHLWIVSRIDKENILIELLDVEGGLQCVASVSMVDDYYGSNLLFFHLPEQDKILLWLAAGQDGQSLFMLEYTDDRISVTELPQFEDFYPPLFSEAGDYFITSFTDSYPVKIEKYAYPSLKLLDSCEIEAEQLGYINMLSNPFALLSFYVSNVILDTDKMAALEPLVVEGYEYYEKTYKVCIERKMQEEKVMVTDISGIKKLGDKHIGVVRYSDSMKKGERKDKLIWFHMN